MLIIVAALAALAVIIVPLVLINRRAKAGKSVKKPLYANLAMFFVMFAVCGCVFLGQGVAAANEAAEVAAAGGGTDWTQAFAYLGAALAVGISGIASGIAVSNSACAAIGALTENESTFGKSIVFVGLAEGIAIYGLLVAIIILLF
ncbi:MAG TPA: ATPase [Candidatus Scatomorpha pullicola]|nr:ATPase [Candidatus Scatomorpha pullicola]